MTVTDVRIARLRSALTAGGRVLLAVSLLIAATAGTSTAAPSPAGETVLLTSPEASASHTLIQNAGQFGPRAQFLLKQGDQRIWLAEDAVWLTVPDRASAATPVAAARGGRELRERALVAAPRSGTAVRFTFEGANQAAKLEPFAAASMHLSYLLGSDPAQWHSDVPAWSGVRYRNLYPGVDLVIGGGATGTIPWRLEAQAAADLQAVALRVDGAEAVNADASGLQLALKGAAVDVALPTWSLANQAGLIGSEVMKHEGAVFGIAPAAQTGQAPQAASPEAAEAGDLISEYKQFLSGAEADAGYSIAVDGVGNAYIAGQTNSYDLIPPGTPGQYDPINYDPTTGDSTREAFAAKYDAAGTLLYATYLGGEGTDNGFGIAVDGGLAYIVGETNSQYFPGLPDLAAPPADKDIFVAALNATGTNVRYVTRLGGDGDDSGYGIAVEGMEAYLVGSTTSTSLPLAPTCAASTNTNLVVAKLSSTGAPVYTTCYGDASYQDGNGIAVRSGMAHVTGQSFSSDAESGDMLVARFKADGTFDASALIQGSDSDWGQGIAVDGSGNIYVTGSTWSSSGFAGLAAGWGGGITDAVAVKLSPALNMGFATYLGGSGDDYGYSIAVDTVQAFYVTGATPSGNFPTTTGACNPPLSTGSDAFLTRMHTESTTRADKITYATCLRDANDNWAYDDWGIGVDTDTGGNAFVTGSHGTTTDSASENAFVIMLKVSSPPTSEPKLSIATSGGVNASLSWTWTGTGTVARYQLFRSSAPYFKPGDWTSPLPIYDQLGTSYPDNNALTQPAPYFYVMKAVNNTVNIGPAAGANSNQVGKFTFQLVKGG